MRNLVLSILGLGLAAIGMMLALYALIVSGGLNKTPEAVMAPPATISPPRPLEDLGLKDPEPSVLVPTGFAVYSLYGSANEDRSIASITLDEIVAECPSDLKVLPVGFSQYQKTVPPDNYVAEFKLERKICIPFSGNGLPEACKSSDPWYAWDFAADRNLGTGAACMLNVSLGDQFWQISAGALHVDICLDDDCVQTRASAGVGFQAYLVTVSHPLTATVPYSFGLGTLSQKQFEELELGAYIEASSDNN